MDYDNALGAEFREVAERQHEGKSARVVVASRVYTTSQDDLWDALTNKERLPRWFAPVEGTLELGGNYKIKGNAKGKITRCEPPYGFDLTWVYYFNTSWVHVRLEAEGSGTRMTLEHIMHKGRMSEGHWRKYGPGATGVGWDIWFLSLGLQLAAPDTDIDQKEQKAWMKTDAGIAFLRTSSMSWAQSHITAGEAADVANAMAEKTAKFYAGG